jgi:hypothetical protein
MELRQANSPPTKDCTAAMGYCMTIDHDTGVSMSVDIWLGYQIPCFLLHRATQKEEKKRHSKELREKRPNPGSFWFTAVGGSFFSDTRTSEWAVWP